jgi:hypothetical protein
MSISKVENEWYDASTLHAPSCRKKDSLSLHVEKAQITSPAAEYTAFYKFLVGTNYLNN